MSLFAGNTFTMTLLLQMTDDEELQARDGDEDDSGTYRSGESSSMDAVVVVLY